MISERIEVNWFNRFSFCPWLLLDPEFSHQFLDKPQKILWEILRVHYEKIFVALKIGLKKGIFAILRQEVPKVETNLCMSNKPIF